MRPFLPALFALALLSIPAMAQAQGSATFATATCPTKIPCDDFALSGDQWAALGNKCITDAFGYSNPEGFFEPYAGLNSSKCLAARRNSINNKVGSPLVPNCCVIPYKENACLLTCKLTN